MSPTARANSRTTKATPATKAAAGKKAAAKRATAATRATAKTTARTTRATKAADRRTAAPAAGIPDDPTTARFDAADEVPAGATVLGVPVYSDLTTPPGAGADVASGYLVQRRFEGRPGQAQALLGDDGTTILALGVGEKGAISADDLRRAAATLARQSGSAEHVATTLLSALDVSQTATDDLAAAVVEGFALGAYRYAGAPSRDRNGQANGAARAKSNGNGRVERVTLVGASTDAVKRGHVAAEATCRARDWINRPPRNLTPRELARLAVAAAQKVGMEAEVWDERRIEAERLGGLMGVAAGAEEPPRLIRLEHRPRRATATVHLVGKGITFDSGGLSIKPAASMMTMKDDMGGAAAVVCATLALAQMKVPVRVVCWVAATENMPSGSAIHPGDVLTARNGKTIEVLNTDAEGRLVLADALSLAVEEKPDAIIDVATLTGGQRVALGDKVAAVMGTDDGLIRKVIAAGAAVGEPSWELPLYAPYRKQLDSEVADLKNVAGGPAASSIMAGLFLKEFAGDRAWAHLDIAAPAWSDSEDGWISKGGTGWGVRTLVELIRNW